jgi:rep
MRKTNKINLDKLLSRHDYLVMQGNDLAKAFGNLKAFEHRLLDYCVSFVGKDSTEREVFETTSNEVLRYFDLANSGENYKRITKSFKTLSENTALYFIKHREDGKKSLVMGHLFNFVEVKDEGVIKFQFSELASPYIFELKQNYYSFKLHELSQIKSKYSLIMLKLIESRRFGQSDMITITGTLEEWKEWFLGSTPESKWTTAQFTNRVLVVALKEIESKMPDITTTLVTVKKGRRITGYEIHVSDKRRRAFHPRKKVN